MPSNTFKVCSSCDSGFQQLTFVNCGDCHVVFNAKKKKLQLLIFFFQILQERRNDRYASRANRLTENQARRRRLQLPAAYISELCRLKEFDLGPMNKVCNYCGAKHWKVELRLNLTKSNIFWMSCCKDGTVKVGLIKIPSAYLKELNENVTMLGQNFKNNLRRYYAAFAFTSCAAKWPNKHAFPDPWPNVSYA